MIEGQNFLQTKEVDIVGRVDGRSHSIDGVGNRYPPPENGVIFNIINSIRLIKKPNHKTDSYNQTVKCDLQKASIVQHLNNIIDDV